MVCIIQQPEFTKSIHDPRDWSERFDHEQPPLKGQLAFCTFLIGVTKRSRWQPRTADSLPPIAFQLGAGLFSWTHSREQAERDVRTFNGNQLRNLGKRGVRLWACVGWGCCGYPETVRVVERGAL